VQSRAMHNFETDNMLKVKSGTKNALCKTKSEENLMVPACLAIA
jgi:hypothetical protein